MWYVIPAILSSVAYSSDVIFAKLALDAMSTYVFVFILAVCYSILAIGMIAWRPREITLFLTDASNRSTIALAILAIVVGTMAADVLMWIAIKAANKQQLPAAMALVHTTPVIALLLVWMVYRESVDWRAACGVFLTVIGCIIALWYS
jgi:drug/metabolite transporter (DMT)-like permease